MYNVRGYIAFARVNVVGKRVYDRLDFSLTTNVLLIIQYP